ncbi:aminopeptidase P family protein [Bacteroides clarus]|uniref:Peptidase M24 n=1 Tax=Bacteroides clarus TaxID=626929 RepID=A0A1Y3YXR5_9BACE|nr:aminopeptidase P family protein [Bacteroides clarus]OUO02636.1 peptidase M24 [Bacteroides clarus]
MNSIINERIAALRAHIVKENIQAFIIPSTDPHLSEYVAPHWQSREWISGFTGSAGTVVVTAKEAGLWTDSRYFLQADRQIEGTGIALYKEMLPETPSIPAFLSSLLQKGDTVGIDGKMFSADEVQHLQRELRQSGIYVKSIADPMQLLWSDRPAMPLAPAFVYDTKYAGKSFTEKLSAVRKKMKAAGAESLLLSALDEIAWLLNIRGSDVHCNPVVVSYLLIERYEIHCFIQPQKVTAELASYFKANGISIHGYKEIEDYLSNTHAESILVNPVKTNYAIYSAICPTCRIINGTSPIALLKAVRNEQEIIGIHAAMQRDGIALVRFLKWLEEAVPAGRETEISVDRKLHEFRAAQPLYMGESFDTIAGYKEHGAIVHYEATPETDVALKPEGFLLLDSGAQYLDGTTDITRTIALGNLTEEEKLDYTLILKGHIALAMAVFPEGTRGAQLDVLARMPIWQQHMNYLHGTGHGVGHFLNVHEGPQSIRMNENPIPLQPGMITSNEPGVYKAGSHGIRTENLVLTVPAGKGMFGNYLKFETITLCPICRKGIIKELLTAEEIKWLNKYHQTVYEKLAPDLNNDEREWLKEACKAIITK